MADENESADSPAESAGTIASSSSAAREETAEQPKKGRRAFLTQNACTRCRQKKSKCDGKRPICGRCEKSNTACVYDIAQEGMTRMQDLQQQIDVKSQEYDRLVALFSALQHSSDQQATTLLARLRLGDSLDTLLAYIGMSEPSPSGKEPESSDSEDILSPSLDQSWPSSPLDDEPVFPLERNLHPGDRRPSHVSESGLYDHRSAATLRLADAPSSFQRQNQAPYYTSAHVQSDYTSGADGVSQSEEMDVSSPDYHGDLYFEQDASQQVWNNSIQSSQRRKGSHSPTDQRRSMAER